MSRNVDKANSVLVRFQEQKAYEETNYKDYSRYKRPTRVTKVKSLEEALEWKRQVQLEINNKTSRIFDITSSDRQIRDLNDELNDLIKERNRWNWHISNNLNGGTIVKNAQNKEKILGGKLIHGVRYFGRALELPEVQELIKNEKKERESRHSKIAKYIDLKRIPKYTKKTLYYNSRCLRKADLENIEKFEDHWRPILREYYKKEKIEEDTNETDEKGIDEGTKQLTRIPTIKEMETWLVERRRRKLLEELSL
ncbi:Isy1p NDAI_0B01220 [Naumovozyma dairenensis CBS 421]|uniref:Pre-mRNA-splicing factor ISY1 n=1 Tax=Naumovozyma dairenensis (strain ATCC 10597 / BCRC 20456 / CBS 421 / NBRC 0211 / NRRL Y-12639) TaxID=1071378 RepID=G0W5U5_NAUDC|nr:hypothetical protein NDAI_0B01220 [Naumovozyma dairenensis CBS 421]CCD23156.1 hypothetical protein NDAI_0B01220 [Naumovozyma dairenensis CBS 421]